MVDVVYKKEVYTMIGDYSKAKRDLGWKPKTKFEDLVKIKVNLDYEKLKARK
jgi:GDPmannose 4,6-dehydratase